VHQHGDWVEFDPIFAYWLLENRNRIWFLNCKKKRTPK